jgi:protease-4
MLKKVATTSQSFDSTNEIAIIYAQGEIMGGEGDVTVIGEGSMRRSLQEEKIKCKSHCPRIDSPGGRRFDI